MTELRKDPVSGNWVIVGYRSGSSQGFEICPFCPGNEHLTTSPIAEITDEKGEWLLRCLPASNPVFFTEVEENRRAEGLYDKMDVVGTHEIIVENRSHTKTLSEFSKRELLSLLELYAARISELKKDKRFRYVQVFKNHGELTGSRLLHPHSHVLATPILTQRIEIELRNALAHYMRKERCLFCDIISQEIRQNKRVISLNKHYIVICPFAARFPFEIWILPRFHAHSFEDLWDNEKKNDLVLITLDIMKRIESLRGAYTVVIHTSPSDKQGSSDNEFAPLKDYFHWHIEILPRDSKSSRYKREDEFYSIPETPEEMASILRTLHVAEGE